MPHNQKGDHYANPAYGAMMEGGKGKMESKAEAYAKAGYMLKRLEVEYAENGFVVKCYWEYPETMKKGKSMAMTEPMGYMEPTIKVFETAEAMTAFVGHAFNEYRHGGKKMKGY